MQRKVNDPDTQPPAAAPPAEETRVYDPRIDPEAKLLCALMFVDDPAGEKQVGQVLDFLRPEEFSHPAHGRLFSLIVEQYTAGQALDGTLIAARCERQGAAGRQGWPAGHTPQSFIVAIGTLDAKPTQITYFAEHVISAAYRRQFQAMARYLSQVADEASEADLFPALLEQGRRQRTARRRLDAFRSEVLGRGGDPAGDNDDEKVK